MLYSTFTAFLGFQVNEGEYKVMGLASYGKPASPTRCARSSARTKDGAFQPRHELLRVPHDVRSARSVKRFIDDVRAPRAPWEPLDPAVERRATVRRHRRERAARARGDPRRHAHAPSRAETGCPTCASAAASRSTASATRASFARADSSASSSRRAPGDAGCALGAALLADRVHFGNPDRSASPTIRTGARASTPRSSRGWPGRTASTLRELPSDEALFDQRSRNDLHERQDRGLDERP